MKVAIYSRVSTKDQNVRQQSLDIRRWCYAQGWDVVKAVLDKESGTLPLRKRKNFRKLLTKPNKQYEAIVVQNLDRLTRNWEDEYYIEEQFSNGELKLISKGDKIDLKTASGRAMFRMKMIMSCFMPEDMRERQAIGIARAKKEGKFRGPGKKSKVN